MDNLDARSPVLACTAAQTLSYVQGRLMTTAQKIHGGMEIYLRVTYKRSIHAEREVYGRLKKS